MRFAEIAETSRRVAATSARGGKVALLADLLRAATPGETALVASFGIGEPRQRQTGVGWASLQDPPAPAANPSLEVIEVDRALGEIAVLTGAGSQAERRRLLDALLARATEPEQRFLVGLLTGELRQGALAGVMTDAVAKAFDVPLAVVRRALLLRGDLPAVAEIAREGRGALDAVRLEVGRPLAPMLAQSAASVADALAKTGPASIEYKLDGARIQVHRAGNDVAVFTRSLDEVTDRLPEIVEAVRALPLDTAVLDGEAIGLGPDGRPRPFQVTGSRFASRVEVDRLREDVPLTPFVFDVLHLDGEDLLDRPGRERAAALASVAAGLLPAALDDARPDDGEAFLQAALSAGHEGVVVKALDAPYDAGRRGAGWVKVKRALTLDLVVLGAEWGHGRRTGYLSNLHLGARDPASGQFVMVGKTFKGLTDALLAWQTERFQEIAVERSERFVRVRPELVVEIAFDGVQSSTRYPGGVALRFARVKGYRPDKPPTEADTIQPLQAMLP